MPEDFESVVGSIDEMLRYTEGPVTRSNQVWRLCHHGIEAAPKHTIDFDTNNRIFWCQICGLPLSYVQIDRYTYTEEYDRNHKIAKEQNEKKKQIFKGPQDDHTHIERKDGVNVIKYSE